MPLGGATAGLIAAGIGGLFKIGKGIHQNNLANKVVVPDATYKSSPYAANVLAEANMRKNAQQPGQDVAARGIYGAQANAAAGIDRNASSGGQALALLSASQGQSDNAFTQLGQQQNQYSENMLNNWNNANQGMTTEGDKVYQDQVRKQMLAINEKSGLRNAGTQNLGGGMNDITNGLFMAGQMKNQKGQDNSQQEYLKYLMKPH